MSKELQVLFFKFLRSHTRDKQLLPYLKYDSFHKYFGSDSELEPCYYCKKCLHFSFNINDRCDCVGKPTYSATNKFYLSDPVEVVKRKLSNISFLRKLTYFRNYFKQHEGKIY